MENRRLIVVSNRLPLTLAEENGVWNAKPGSGGLVAAMEPILRENGGLWIGWTGEDGSLDSQQRDRLLSEASRDFEYVPVDFEPGAGTAFYEGYPNQTVWPLFHFFPSRMNFDPDSWPAYVEGNQAFARKVSQRIDVEDAIWIHDYHLMLLPGMLRENAPNAKIGFFLHIPFPASEVFSMLPRGAEVLRGLLGADLIAFHTHRHLHHFRSSLLRIAGVESEMDSVEYEGRTIRLEALPIGIAPQGFADLLNSDAETAKRIGEYRQQYEGQKVIVAVDRLDYSKGLPERLRTFRRLLTQQPDLKDRVVLVQVAVPSREGIGEYQNLRSEINELVGEINGHFGTPEWTPIVYLRHPVDRATLAALYAVADVAWVTPLRDGMNLVAKEYCACKPEGDGVLVLSQFAGAAAEMGEALLVNPFDEELVAAAVAKALNMDTAEKAERMQHLRERVHRNDVFHWAESFLRILDAKEPARKSAPAQFEVQPLKSAWNSAAERLIILDYDGTLVGLGDDPAKTAPSSETISVLSRLTADEKNTVAVLSGRRASDLERWLGAVPNLILSAEHGAAMRPRGSVEWQLLNPASSQMDWKARVRTVLQHFVDRAPGSLLEEKEYSLVWHYRRVEPEFGKWLARELAALLEGLLADTDARSIKGHKIVEIRPVWANKGALTTRLLAEHPAADFHLAAGDDVTDEDIFEHIGSDAFTIHIGPEQSRARARLRDPAALLRVLNELAGG